MHCMEFCGGGGGRFLTLQVTSSEEEEEEEEEEERLFNRAAPETTPFWRLFLVKLSLKADAVNEEGWTLSCTAEKVCTVYVPTHANS